MQYIPEPVKEELRALFSELTDGRPQDYKREYRPRVDGPARWLLIKDGQIQYEVEVEWDAETEKRTFLSVVKHERDPEWLEAMKTWCS